MTALYSGEIPEQVRAAFSSKLLKKMESEVAPETAVSARKEWSGL
jgi:hypothetical protein